MPFLGEASGPPLFSYVCSPQILTVCIQLSEHRVAAGTPTNAEHARFLGSHNPAQVKRTVLASFTDVLLLPVTIVPRTVGKAVGAAITTGSSAAVQGIQMLNPQRWGGTGAMGQSSRNGNGGGGGGGSFPFARMPSWNGGARDGYSGYEKGGGDGMLFDIGADDDEEPETPHEKTFSEKGFGDKTTPRCTLFLFEFLLYGS